MARLADPIEARKGTFLDSFPSKRGYGERIVPDEVLGYCAATEAAMKQLDARGEVVYTRMPIWGKRGDTWQVFLLP